MGAMLLAVALVFGSNPGENYDAAAMTLDPLGRVRLGMTAAQVDAALGEMPGTVFLQRWRDWAVYPKAGVVVEFDRVGKVLSKRRRLPPWVRLN